MLSILLKFQQLHLICNFIWYWKNAYLEEQLTVAGSAMNKNLSKVKYCSKFHLFQYRLATLERMLYTTNGITNVIMICKKTGAFIYQLFLGEFPFAVTFPFPDFTFPSREHRHISQEVMAENSHLQAISVEG